MSGLLSYTKTTLILNSKGGEVYLVSHLVRDTEEDATREGIEGNIINEMRKLQAKYFQNPLLNALALYKDKIYHTPRTIFSFIIYSFI